MRFGTRNTTPIQQPNVGLSIEPRDQGHARQQTHIQIVSLYRERPHGAIETHRVVASGFDAKAANEREPSELNRIRQVPGGDAFDEIKVAGPVLVGAAVVMEFSKLSTNWLISTVLFGAKSAISHRY